jgi:hypothetical protein
MALVPNRPAAVARRITAYSLIADVVIALIVGLAISSVVGWIIFIAGLVITGVMYYNFSQVRKTRGM